MAEDIVQRIRNTLPHIKWEQPLAYERELQAADEIERLRALVEIGDELVRSIRDHDLNGAVVREWEESRRG